MLHAVDVWGKDDERSRKSFVWCVKLNDVIVHGTMVSSQSVRGSPGWGGRPAGEPPPGTAFAAEAARLIKARTTTTPVTPWPRWRQHDAR